MKRNPLLSRRNWRINKNSPQWRDLKVWIPLQGNYLNYGISRGVSVGRHTSAPSLSWSSRGTHYDFSSGNFYGASQPISIGYTYPLTVSIWGRATTNDSSDSKILTLKGGGGLTTDFMEFDGTGGSSPTGFNVRSHWGFASSYVSYSGSDFFDGEWKHIVYTYNGGQPSHDHRLYVNGSLIDTDSQSVGSNSTTSPDIYIGYDRYLGNRRWKGDISDLRIYSRELSADEVRALYNDPFELYSISVPEIGKAPTTGTAYSLTCDTGTYTLTGQDVGAETAGTLSLDPGSHTVTGNDQGLLAETAVSLDTGSYTLTGSDLAFAHAYKVSPDVGVYTYTGYDVDLIFTPAGGTAYSLTCDTGTYTLAGQDVGILYATAVSLESGTYTILGNDANLLTETAVSLESGSYTLTGSDLVLSHGVTLSLESGSYVLTGQDPDFVLAYALALESGVYTYTGYDVDLISSEDVVFDKVGTIRGVKISGTVDSVNALALIYMRTESGDNIEDESSSPLEVETSNKHYTGSVGAPRSTGTIKGK